jgi:hypothetical protein
VSRAGAVAYEVPVTLDPLDQPVDLWPGRGDSSAYRLLGDLGQSFGGPVPLVLDNEPVMPLAFQGGYIDHEVELPDAYFSAQAMEPRRAPARLPSARLVFAILAVILLVIGLMLVTPVLARVTANNSGSSYSISKYADLRSGGQAPVSQAPNIDVSAGSSAAAQPVSPATSPPGSYSLVSPPSISVQEIEAVLAKYGSPAAGQGQSLYDLGVKYGIDPAYALAFFVHESACGTRGVARSTHSLGNIRWTDGYDNYQGYRSYPTWQQGMEDWYKLITDLYINGWGLQTVDQIIPVYAPAGDSNSPPDYISSIKFLVDSWRGK